MLPRARRRFIPILAAVFVLLNVDAAIACSTKGKAYATAMKSDLRNVSSAQEVYHARTGRFAASVAELDFRSSTGVGPMQLELRAGGFVARTSHTQIETACAVFVGDSSRPADAPPQAQSGVPWCRDPASRFPSWFSTGSSSSANRVSLMLAVLTLTTALFLKGARKRNWPAIGLAILTFVFVFIPIVTCGPPPYLHTGVFALLGLGLFVYAARRALLIRAT